jgi:hypothetical protein
MDHRCTCFWWVITRLLCGGKEGFDLRGNQCGWRNKCARATIDNLKKCLIWIGTFTAFIAIFGWKETNGAASLNN